MLLLVGLGNPGPGYAGNRHNIGFMAVDAIARRHGFAPFRARHHGLIAEGRLAGVRVLAFKPTTYMNESGLAVGRAARFFKIAPEAITVIHDDIDLAAGKLRVKRDGGHGGHNGLRSIDAHIGTDYWRVRLGVGHPGDKDRVEGYVLSDFAKAERPLFTRLVDAVAEAAPLLGGGDGSRFMNRVTILLHPPKPRPRSKPVAEPATSDSGIADDG